MSEHKHTPGLWRIIAKYHIGSVNADHANIADCGCSSISIKERQANARLIAATPDLLKEHKQWALAFGHALTDALQGNYRRINELAHGLKIIAVDGEPALESAAIKKALEG